MSALTEYLNNLAAVFKQVKVTDADGRDLNIDAAGARASEWILTCRTEGAKVLLIGNGGSAAIVSHLQNDLCDSVGVRAMVFNEPPFLTAVANDHGYETFFEQAVKLWAADGDLLVAVSSSGKSKNILRAVREMRTKQTRVVTLSGFEPDNPLRSLGDINFYVPSKAYGVVETAHGVLGHYLSDAAMARKNETAVRS